MVLYLLGNLAEADQESLEETLLVDEEAFARLEAVEDDLIDAYARGELSKTDQQRFRQRFLTTQGRRQRVAFGRALATEMSPKESSKEESTEAAVPRPASRGWALRLAVAANILLALGLAWLAAQTLNLKGQVRELASQRLDAMEGRESLSDQAQDLSRRLAEGQERAVELDQMVKTQAEELTRKGEQIAALQGDLARRTSTRSSAQPLVASILLSIGVRSEGGSAQLEIPAAADQVELQVDLEGDDAYDDFRVTLRTGAGAQVWGRKGVEAVATEWGSELLLKLPAELLKPGRYELAVEGLAASGDVLPVGFYGFSVVR
ncbi:MAG: hypothetical protein K0U98_03135 [Deltaproteobacteria bacterium]|nr:hypothetical protein [Deltaproteobacteria bacterium]